MKTSIWAAALSLGALCTAPEVVAAVTPSDFAHEVAITVSGYTGGSSLENFPVLVRLGSRIPGFSYSQIQKNDHSDLAFFSADGTVEFPYEVDTWNPSGESLVWVRIPSLSNNLSFKACFGSATASGTASAADVWTKYKAVWHMNPGAGDSVGNRPITAVGSVSAVSTSDLGSGYAITSRGANALKTDYKFGDVSSSGVFTLAGWFRQEFDGNNARMFSTKKSHTDNGLELILVGENGDLYQRGSGSGTTLSFANGKAAYFPDTGTWLHFGGVYNGASGKIYANGAAATSGAIAAASNYPYPLSIGNTGNSPGSENCYLGVIDEVRVYDGAATDDWMAAEYAAVAPAFLSYGPLDGDQTMPSFVTAPTIAASQVEGVYTFSAELATGVADVYAVLTDCTLGVTTTNLIATAASAGPVSGPISLVFGHAYKFSAYAQNAGGYTSVKAGESRFVAGDVVPDTFGWGGQADGVSWSSGPWIPANTERTMPMYDGDVAIVSNKTVVLDCDVAVSRLDLRKNLKADGVATRNLTFVNSDTGEARLNLYRSQVLGDRAAVDAMTVTLSSSLVVYGAEGYTGSDHSYIAAKITGGSAENPCSLSLGKCGTGWHYTYLNLMNTANDWRGDIHLRGETRSNWHITVSAGAGNSGTWSDGCFGDPANEIYFDGDNCRLGLNRFDSTEGFKRKVHGSGSIRGRSVETQWYGESRYPLFLGDGFVADPKKPSSDYGRIEIWGGGITMHSNAEFDIDVGVVGETRSCDVIAMDVGGATSFTGALKINSLTEIPAGTEFTVVTVTKGAGTFTFSPSSVTEGWNTKCTGDADNGWTVVVTKAREGADVANYPVSLIANDHVTANCEVLDMGGAASLPVRIYYGTSDGGTDAAAWDGYAELTADAVGMYAKRVEGLSVDTTYYFRAAVVVGGDPVFSLDNAVSCVTVPVSRPDVFTWIAGASTWATDANWSINTPYERHYPGYAGDFVKFVYDSSRTTQTVSMGEDETVGKIDGSGGNWDAHYRVSLEASSPAVLTFDNLGAEARFDINGGGLNEIAIGADGSDALTVRLAGPLRLYRNAAWGANFRLYAKITGGSASSPCPIAVEDAGNEYAECKYYFYNAANDFVGDVVLQKYNAGHDLLVYVGDSSHPYADSILGDASNAVSLSKYTVLQVGAGVESVVWHRAVTGGGTLRSTAALTLSPAAVFTADSTAFALKVSSSGALSDSVGTRYAVTVDADDTAVATKIAFSSASALTLNGTFVVEPDDPSVKIPVGARWAVGTIAASAGSLGRLWFAHAGNWHVYAEGDATDGWTIYAEKTAPGLSIVVR